MKKFLMKEFHKLGIHFNMIYLTVFVIVTLILKFNDVDSVPMMAYCVVSISFIVANLIISLILDDAVFNTVTYYVNMIDWLQIVCYINQTLIVMYQRPDKYSQEDISKTIKESTDDLELFKNAKTNRELIRIMKEKWKAKSDELEIK